MSRLRCALAPAAAPHALRPALCATTLYSGGRPFSSLIRSVSDTVTAKVAQLTEDVWLADEKLVTEPRRKIEPQRALQQNLAERLATQRGVRQGLVPMSIRVDKSKQYVEFTWPASAVERAMAASAAQREAEEAASSPKENAASTYSLGDGDRQTENKEDGSDTNTHLSTSTSSSSSSAKSTLPLQLNEPLRTRALAEFLRAYTPSTDGALGARDIVIYGRRGVTITQIVPMGNYALRFVFSDGHTGGIYSYEYLFYLTGPTTKYGLMRAYIKDLRRRRKPRDPPKRAPSRRVVKAAQQQQQQEQ